jgi:hypothetical protein
MNNNYITPAELLDSKLLLQEIYEEVVAQDSRLGTKPASGSATESFRRLRETRAVLGDPKDNLVKLTPELFSSVGIELKGTWKQSMRDRYDYYYMTLPVTLVPGRGIQFVLLEASFQFSLSLDDQPIVQSMFPTSEWKDVLQWGAGMRVALDADLNYTVGIDADLLTNNTIPQQIKAKIFNDNELQGLITIPSFRYTLGRAEAIAAGVGNNFCFWRIQNPELREMYDITLSAIFKVPKKVRTLQLTGTVIAEPSFAWLTSNLRDVFEYLSEKAQTFLRQRDDERQGKDRLPVGDFEEWTLNLPQ